MERESFEDVEVADMLNAHFISIKVDREERPDIDHIYMSVCQALSGQGGWPLTIIMSPDKKPFYVGTYFPKHDRMGMPGVLTLLDSILFAWKNKRSDILSSAESIVMAIGQPNIASGDIDTQAIINDAYSEFRRSFDKKYGGFGTSPKFPTPHNLYFLLRYWYVKKEESALEMVEKTLESMYRGGIYDHIGFGFSRYSTDQKWLIPHFEKMLYDNALLAIAYLETYQATKKEKYSNIAEQILTYILRDMTSPEGGFYSAEDADSEGVEGKFYAWTPKEVKQILGESNGEMFCKHYDINERGSFEGFSIPNLINNLSLIEDIFPKSSTPANESLLEECRIKLFEYRNKRIHPYKDDKILTSWNGLMIAAMAIGGRILGEAEYVMAAEKAVNFLLTRLVNENGRLLARYRDGNAANPAYVDDYAFLVWGLIELYETTYKPEYLQKALVLNDDLLKYFWDKENGGLFLYGNDSEQLLTRPKEVYDGAAPSGNSVATMNFLRLARLTGRSDLEDKALGQFKTFGNNLKGSPRAYTFMLSALLFADSRAKEIILVSGVDKHSSEEMLNIVRESFMPFTTCTFYSDEYEQIKRVIPFLENYKSVSGKPTAYVCENFACSYPVTNAGEFKQILQ